MTAPFSAAFLRRVRVLRVRQRIEEVATGLLGDPGRRHQFVRARLLLLLADVPAERWWEVHRVVDRARAVYGATSDVLHSRRAFADVPELREWESVADEVSALADAHSSRPPSITGSV